MRYFTIVAACAALFLSACGAGDGDGASSASGGSGSDGVTPAQFVTACQSYYDSELTSPPEGVASEAYCECIMMEMVDTSADMMGTIGEMSGEDISSLTSSYGWRNVTRQAENYRAAVRLEKRITMSGDDFDMGASSTEMLSSMECSNKLGAD